MSVKPDLSSMSWAVGLGHGPNLQDPYSFTQNDCNRKRLQQLLFLKIKDLETKIVLSAKWLKSIRQKLERVPVLLGFCSSTSSSRRVAASPSCFDSLYFNSLSNIGGFFKQFIRQGIRYFFTLLLNFPKLCLLC